MILCPMTEAQLGDGFFPAAEYFAAGGRFAVGSDSNARIDAIEELRLAEYGQRLRLERRVRLGGATAETSAWSCAAQCGGRALGQRVGAIEVGSFADLLVLEHEAPIFAGIAAEGWLDAWLTGGSAAEVSHLYLGGQRRDRDGLAGPGTASTRFARVMRELLV
jgi:formimidoylglutamate deiminase